MEKRLKLASYTVKRYEPQLEKYFFYNSKNRTFWETDFKTGSVISLLDGNLSVSDIISTLAKNNSEIPKEKLSEYFRNNFEFLLKEEFLCVAN